MTFGKLTSLLRFRSLPLFPALLLLAFALHAAPRKPMTDGEVLERLPLRAADASARELSALRAAMTAAATDPAPAARLAGRYFDLAMARGDPRYVGYAEAVVARFPEPLPASLGVIRGQLRQYRHDFEGALADFQAALTLDPELATAHAWRGAIFLVRADYAAAQKECDALRRLDRDTLHGACIGLVQAYRGQLEAADRSLRGALAKTTDADNRLWLLTRMGEVAAWRGQPAQAEQRYREALGIGHDDGYLLAAWSDFLLDAGRAAEVRKQLAGWEASDSLLLRLAEAARALKLPDAETLAKVLEERFAAARQRGDTTHRAEEARYYLRLRGDANEALRLAAENYRVQREPRDARILLEAALAAGDSAAAQPVRDWLRASGFEDARMKAMAQESALASPRSEVPGTQSPGRR